MGFRYRGVNEADMCLSLMELTILIVMRTRALNKLINEKDHGREGGALLSIKRKSG